MNRMCVSAVALLVLAGAAHGGVELRFRARNQNPQTLAGAVPVLSTAWSGVGGQAATSFIDIAVQARVTGSGSNTLPLALAGFDFDIAIAGEAENLGQFWISRISSSGAYVSDGAAWAIGSSPNPGAASVGSFGVANTYSYLPGLQPPKFNGSINATQGTFTNDPATQEIGLVGGLTSGTALLGTPDIDPGFSGSPATFTGPYVTDPLDPHFGSPAYGAIASLDPTIGAPYFAEGSWSDIYHFRYTIKSNAQRTLSFELRNAHASSFTQFVYSTNDLWGIDSAADTVAQPAAFPVQVTPTPSTVALMGLGGLMIARRRRA